MTEINVKKTMRDVFIAGLYERMKQDDRIFFLSADFGAPQLDRLRTDFPDRFINVGIAEQNTINVATGLALEGYIVYGYAIATFMTMRCYEQVRLNLAVSSQIKPINVNLIGVGAGLSYDVAGPTHHGFEDITIMRLLPNFRVYSPSDWKLAEALVEESIKFNQPKYFRFDAKPLPAIYTDLSQVDLEAGFHQLFTGEETCLISTGFTTHTAIKVAEKLKNVGVIDVFRLKPLNEDHLFDKLKKYKSIITIEEAFINGGGLDSLISKILIDHQAPIKLKRLGFNDKYVFDLGSREHLHQLNNLDEDYIIETIRSG